MGPLATEAALLLDVVAERLASMQRTAETGPDGPTDDAPAPAATGDALGAAGTDGTGRCPECGSIPGASCTACPLCRFMALLRGERPEATAKLVDGALMIIRTLRSLVPDPPESSDTTSTATGSTEPPAGQQPPARRGGLEHIDIS